ncbi:MAG: hypothetical protein ABIL25_07670 [candidate division WOR-3 bacterium]
MRGNDFVPWQLGNNLLHSVATAPFATPNFYSKSAAWQTGMRRVQGATGLMLNTWLQIAVKTAGTRETRDTSHISTNPRPVKGVCARAR